MELHINDKNIENKKNTINNNFSKKNINIDKSIRLINNDKNNNFITKKINNKYTKKLYMKKIDIHCFKKILMSEPFYEKIICKYKDNNLCYNYKKYGHCDFKHINNEVLINDYLKSNDIYNSDYSNLIINTY